LPVPWLQVGVVVRAVARQRREAARGQVLGESLDLPLRRALRQGAQAVALPVGHVARVRVGAGDVRELAEVVVGVGRDATRPDAAGLIAGAVVAVAGRAARAVGAGGQLAGGVYWFWVTAVPERGVVLVTTRRLPAASYWSASVVPSG